MLAEEFLVESVEVVGRILAAQEAKVLEVLCSNAFRRFLLEVIQA